MGNGVRLSLLLFVAAVTGFFIVSGFFILKDGIGVSGSTEHNHVPVTVPPTLQGLSPAREIPVGDAAQGADLCEQIKRDLQRLKPASSEASQYMREVVRRHGDRVWPCLHGAWQAQYLASVGCNPSPTTIEYIALLTGRELPDFAGVLGQIGQVPDDCLAGLMTALFAIDAESQSVVFARLLEGVAIPAEVTDFEASNLLLGQILSAYDAAAERPDSRQWAAIWRRLADSWPGAKAKVHILQLVETTRSARELWLFSKLAYASERPDEASRATAGMMVRDLGMAISRGTQKDPSLHSELWVDVGAGGDIVGRVGTLNGLAYASVMSAQHALASQSHGEAASGLLRDLRDAIQRNEPRAAYLRAQAALHLSIIAPELLSAEMWSYISTLDPQRTQVDDGEASYAMASFNAWTRLQGGAREDVGAAFAEILVTSPARESIVMSLLALGSDASGARFVKDSLGQRMSILRESTQKRIKSVLED